MNGYYKGSTTTGEPESTPFYSKMIVVSEEQANAITLQEAPSEPVQATQATVNIKNEVNDGSIFRVYQSSISTTPLISSHCNCTSIAQAQTGTFVLDAADNVALVIKQIPQQGSAQATAKAVDIEAGESYNFTIEIDDSGDYTLMLEQ